MADHFSQETEKSISLLADNYIIFTPYFKIKGLKLNKNKSKKYFKSAVPITQADLMGVRLA